MSLNELILRNRNKNLMKNINKMVDFQMEKIIFKLKI